MIAIRFRDYAAGGAVAAGTNGREIASTGFQPVRATKTASAASPRTSITNPTNNEMASDMSITLPYVTLRDTRRHGMPWRAVAYGGAPWHSGGMSQHIVPQTHPPIVVSMPRAEVTGYLEMVTVFLPQLSESEGAQSELANLIATAPSITVIVGDAQYMRLDLID